MDIETPELNGLEWLTIGSILNNFLKYSRNHAVRLPTLRWMLSDALGVVDCQANAIIKMLIAEKYLKCDNGGWITSCKVQ